MTRLRGVLGLLAVSMLITAVGCGGDSSESTTTKKARATTTTTSTTIDPLVAGVIPDFTEAFQLIKQQVGEPLEARGVAVQLNGTASMQIRQKVNADPTKKQSRDNVDTWRYDGKKWTLARPVSLTVGDIQKLDGSFWDPTTVAWSKFPPLGPQALKVLDAIEKPRLSGLSLSKNGASISISVTGVRGTGSLVADGHTGAVTKLARD